MSHRVRLDIVVLLRCGPFVGRFLVATEGTIDNFIANLLARPVIIEDLEVDTALVSGQALSI